MPDGKESSTVAVQTLESEEVFAPALHHVNLATRRMQAMIDWYSLVVGMRIVHRAEFGTWMTNDNANHRLALLERDRYEEDPAKLQHTGLRHTAFEYRDLDELLGTYVRLKREGIEPKFCLNHGMTISFYYADPDGNRVELQADNYGDWSRSTEFMVSDPRFTADPLGPDIDPDALVEARSSGLSPQELHERSYAGDFAAEDPIAPELR